jgi:hypothetical protein
MRWAGTSMWLVDSTAHRRHLSGSSRLNDHVFPAACVDDVSVSVLMLMLMMLMMPVYQYKAIACLPLGHTHVFLILWVVLIAFQ